MEILEQLISEQLGVLTPEEIEIAVSAVKLYRLNKIINKQKSLKL